MKHMKRLKFKTLLPVATMFLYASLCFTSCKDDDDDTISEEDTETSDSSDSTAVDSDSTDVNFVLSYAILGSTGDYSYYTVQYDSVMNGTLTAEDQGITETGYRSFKQINDKIYSIGGLGENTLTTIEKNDDGDLEEVSTLEGFTNAISDIIETDDNNLLAVEMSVSSDVINFYIMNEETTDIEETNSVSVSNIQPNYTDEAPYYSGMVQSGDYIFLSYYLCDASTYATDYTDTARIAVFSYPDLEYVKTITDTRVGPIGGYGEQHGLFKDKDDNIYALSHSNLANGYSQSTKDGGILKINAGETDFDEDYFFEIEDYTDGLNTAHVKYLGDGKLFALINTEESSEQTTWSDAPLKGAIINIDNNSVNYIDGLPEHTGTGRTLDDCSVYAADGYVYMCVPGDEDISVYQIDVDNYTATEGAVVDASFVGGFFEL